MAAQSGFIDQGVETSFKSEGITLDEAQQNVPDQFKKKSMSAKVERIAHLLLAVFFSYVLGLFGVHYLWVFALYIFLYNIENSIFKHGFKIARQRHEARAKARKIRLRSESSEWLNLFIERAWPQIGPWVSNEVKKTLKATFEKIMTDTKPPGVSDLQVARIDFGELGPQFKQFRGIRVENSHIYRVDLDLEYDGDFEMELQVVMLHIHVPIVLKHISVHGRLRVELELCEAFPFVKTVYFCFKRKPTLSYSIKPLNFDICNIPAFKTWLKDAIDLSLKNFVVYPNVFTLNLMTEEQLKSLAPKPLLGEDAGFPKSSLKVEKAYSTSDTSLKRQIKRVYSPANEQGSPRLRKKLSKKRSEQSLDDHKKREERRLKEEKKQHKKEISSMLDRIHRGEDKKPGLMKTKSIRVTHDSDDDEHVDAILRITLKAANNLIVSDIKTSDPYVVMKYQGRLKKSKVYRKTLKSEFGKDTDFEFAVNRDNQDQTIHFIVMDWNRITEDDFMGRCSVDVTELVSKTIDGFIEREIRLEKVKHGSLAVRIDYVLD